MGLSDIVALFGGQPELYAILALMLYGIKKFFPIIKNYMAIEQSKLEAAIRHENLLKDILTAVNTVNSNLYTLATKDDVIELLIHHPKKKVLNGSGSIVKQGID